MTYSLDLKQLVVNYAKKFKDSYRGLSNKFNIGKSTIHRWINHSSKTKNVVKHRIINVEILHFIKRSISQNPYATVKNLQLKINRKFNVDMSIGTIYNCFKICNIRRKRASVRICNRSLKELKQQRKELINKVNDIGQENIISIDETYIWEDRYLNYGRAIGNKKIVKYTKRKHHRRYSVLMAVTNNKIIAYQTYSSSINSNVFGEFIKANILNIYVGKYLLMDNVSFHKSKHIRQIICDSNNDSLFIPPYSPECNPIEEVFSKIKQYVKRRLSVAKKIDVDRYLRKSVENVSSIDLNNYFRHAFG